MPIKITFNEKEKSLSYKNLPKLTKKKWKI